MLTLLIQVQHQDSLGLFRIINNEFISNRLSKKPNKFHFGFLLFDFALFINSVVIFYFNSANKLIIF